jgi:hypothetical protein
VDIDRQFDQATLSLVQAFAGSLRVGPSSILSGPSEGLDDILPGGPNAGAYLV